MNKHQYQLRELIQALKRQIRQHSDIIASTACGALMGVLFMTAIARYDAKPPTVVRPSYRPMPITAFLTEPDIPPSSSSTTLTPARPAAPEILLDLTSDSSLSSSAEAATSSVGNSLSSPAESERPASDFPSLIKTSFPVGKTPNWGAMRTPAEWNRTYGQMTADDFVSIPRYDLKTLTIPMETLTNPIKDENIPTITAKLFYSTRYMGKYDLDAGEHTGGHFGVDLKLARGTGVGAIGGGRVSSVQTTQRLGLHVIIEHRLKTGETFYSVYGHLDSASVTAGQDVKPGEMIGTVGMTGNTSAPHLHLQTDIGAPGEAHVPAESENGMVNPTTFISTYRNGE